MIFLRTSGQVGVALALVLMLGSCAKEQGPVRDAQAESSASMLNRLQGRWVLVSFQPEVPLDPALQRLLDAQMQQFVVDVQGVNLTAQGPGVTVARTIAVKDAFENHFKATLTDPYGIATDSACDLAGPLLVVNGWTAPWRGKATFRRG
jgi:hypothetical protein